MAASMGQGSSQSSAAGGSGDATGSTIGGVNISVGKSENQSNVEMVKWVGIAAVLAFGAFAYLKR